MYHQLHSHSRSPQSSEALALQSRNNPQALHTSLIRKQAELTALLQIKESLAQARQNRSANFLNRHDVQGKAFSTFKLPALQSPAPAQPKKSLHIVPHTTTTSPLVSKRNTLLASWKNEGHSTPSRGGSLLKLRPPQRLDEKKALPLATDTRVYELSITMKKSMSDCSTQTESEHYSEEGIVPSPHSKTPKLPKKIKLFKIQTNMPSPKVAESRLQFKPVEALTKQPTPRSFGRSLGSIDGTSMPASPLPEELTPTKISSAQGSPAIQYSSDPPKLALDLPKEEPVQEKPNQLAALMKLQQSIAEQKLENKESQVEPESKAKDEKPEDPLVLDKEEVRQPDASPAAEPTEQPSEAKPPPPLKANNLLQQLQQGIKKSYESTAQASADEQNQVLQFQKLIKDKLKTHLRKDLQYYREKIRASKTEKEKIDVFEEQLGQEYLDNYLPNKPIDKPSKEETSHLLSLVNKIRPTDGTDSSRNEEADKNSKLALQKKKTKLMAHDVDKQLKSNQEELKRLSSASSLPTMTMSSFQSGNRSYSLAGSEQLVTDLNSKSLALQMKEKLGDRLLKKIRFQQKVLARKQDK